MDPSFCNLKKKKRKRAHELLIGKIFARIDNKTFALFLSRDIILVNDSTQINTVASQATIHLRTNSNSNSNSWKKINPTCTTFSRETSTLLSTRRSSFNSHLLRKLSEYRAPFSPNLSLSLSLFQFLCFYLPGTIINLDTLSVTVVPCCAERKGEGRNSIGFHPIIYLPCRTRGRHLADN